MTKFKKIAALGAMLLVVGATSITVFATSAYKSPAESVAGLTGKTVENVIAERSETGNSYGSIASEAGKLEDFKKEMLEIKKEALVEKVAAGTMTQAEADKIIAAVEENQATCDGTGSARIGQKMGAGFGGKNCNGQGKGQGGAGRGQGSCSGCQAQ